MSFSSFAHLQGRKWLQKHITEGSAGQQSQALTLKISFPPAFVEGSSWHNHVICHHSSPSFSLDGSEVDGLPPPLAPCLLAKGFDQDSPSSPPADTPPSSPSLSPPSTSREEGPGEGEAEDSDHLPTLITAHLAGINHCFPAACPRLGPSDAIFAQLLSIAHSSQVLEGPI